MVIGALFYIESKTEFFAYGFAKSEIDNITNEELNGFKDLATEMLNLLILIWKG